MAVYTDVPDDALRAFLLDYDLGELLAFRGIAEGVENSNYALPHGSGRLHPDPLRAARGPGRAALVPRADGAPGARRGLPCPLPVKARDGQALRELAGRPAAICTFLPGVWPRRVRPEHCAPLGAALARLHLAGEGFDATRPNALGPAGWPPLLDRCRAEGDGVQPGLVAELDAALAAIRARLARAGRAAGGAHPRRPLPRQRLLPARRGREAARLRPDRLLLRLHRPPGLRPRRVPERLVLRAGPLLQRDQGARAALRLRARCARCRRPSARRCPCSAAAPRCASC